MTLPANCTIRSSASGAVRIKISGEVNQIPQVDIFDRHGTGRLPCDFALTRRALAVSDNQRRAIPIGGWRPGGSKPSVVVFGPVKVNPGNLPRGCTEVDGLASDELLPGFEE